MAQDASQCSAMDGNSDLYGLGVRIGVYGQWTATLVTTIFDAENESALRLLNLVVQAAIFVGLCSESANHANAVGAVITQFLLCGSLSSVTGDGISHLGHVSGLLRSLFYTGLSSYAIWFWFTGMHAMRDPSCRQIVFFGPSVMTGWFPYVAKVLSALSLVVCLYLACRSLQTCVQRFRKALSSGLNPAPHFRPQVELSLVFLSASLLGLSMATIEYLIQANNVQGVGSGDIGSVAQLIPLIAGVLACFLSSSKILSRPRRLLLQKRCWLIFGRHL